ncbi:MAG: porin family protein [Janthinobacterium lividum]
MLLSCRSPALLLPAFFFAGLLAGHAQTATTWAVGPQVGGNVSTGGYRMAGSAFTPHALAGLEAGVAVRVRRAHWALQPALLYVQQGFVLREDDQFPNPYGAGTATVTDHLTYRLHYVALPLVLAYAQKVDGRGLQAFAGGYVSRLLGGALAYDYAMVRPDFRYAAAGRRHITPSQDFVNDGNEHFQPFDAGLRVGAGYSARQLAFQVGYTAGLRNTWAPRDGNVTYRNRGFFATATYFVPHG